MDQGVCLSAGEQGRFGKLSNVVFSVSRLEVCVLQKALELCSRRRAAAPGATARRLVKGVDELKSLVQDGGRRRPGTQMDG